MKFLKYKVQLLKYKTLSKIVWIFIFVCFFHIFFYKIFICISFQRAQKKLVDPLETELSEL